MWLGAESTRPLLYINGKRAELGAESTRLILYINGKGAWFHAKQIFQEIIFGKHFKDLSTMRTFFENIFPTFSHRKTFILEM